MWRTKANRMSTRDWIRVPILLYINSAACHVLQRNYGMKLFRVLCSGCWCLPAHPVSYFLPLVPLRSFHWLVPTKPCSSLQAEGPAWHVGPGHASDTEYVSVSPRRALVPSWKPTGIPAAPDLPPAWAPCPSPCSQRRGGRDVSRAVRSLRQMTCTIRTLATLMLNIYLLFFLLSRFLIDHNTTRQHKVLVYPSIFLASLKNFNVLKTAATT